ncbi:MAG: hypothetical protein ACOCV2_00430, partial [Persicimonas sp.]
MLDVSKAIPLKGLTAVALTAVLFALGGCGGEEPCADVDCEFGECDSQSGECVNSESCKNDGDCLPGFDCEEGACEALAECSVDDDCETGVCSDDGACVNPDSCEENDDCLDRTYCEDGSCEWDPCNDKACKRGTCEPGTDRCVSRDSCTDETERRDCIAGEKCADGACEDEDDFCDALECERGECSFEEGGCANADDCEGDDDCLEGNFCNDQNRCQPDLCVENEVECDDGGVCEPATGECEYADPCETHDDCLESPAHVCIEGQCSLESTACGDAQGDGGCPGNQECDIDRDEQTAECLEASPCETSIDCHDDRQCGGFDCIDPIECSEDVFEPNDSEDEATAFHDHAQGNSVRASLCADDTDVYTFDSGEIIEESVRGELLVEVDVPDRDRGLGQLEVELTDEDGDTQTADTGPMGEDGSLRLSNSISVDAHQEYTVEISAGDEMNDAGVEYDLSVNLIPEESLETCEDAPTLEADSRVSGDTGDAESTFFRSNCLPGEEGSGEIVYELEVDSAQEMTFDLEPQLSSADLSMSLRERCTQPATERDCVDSELEGAGESMTALLEEGTYYVIVQPGREGSGGPFELTTESVYTACG